MKRLLPLALLTATLFACNTPTEKEQAAATTPGAKDVLTLANMYDIYSVHAALGTGDAIASHNLFTRAVTFYDKNDIPRSIDLFKAAICRRPSANAYYQLGAALTKAGFYEDAIKSLRIAEQLGYTPVANLMYRLAQATSNLPMASERLRDSLMLHYMEVAIQMGYPHSEDFLKNGAFGELRNARDFRTTFDEAMAAGPGSSSPGRLFWETFRNDFKPLNLPVTINTVWIQSHKPGNPISYDYDKFIPEMRDAEFARESGPEYYYTGIVKQDSNFTALIYAGQNEELADANHYTPTFFMLTSFTRNGRIIDKMRVGGQSDFTDTFRVFVLQPSLAFEIRNYHNVYKYDPDQAGYEKNYVLHSELLSTNNYRIAPDGRFEKVETPLAMR